MILDSLKNKEQYAALHPRFKQVFDFIDNTEAMEEKISEILAVHARELETVYEAIADKKDEYLK